MKIEFFGFQVDFANFKPSLSIFLIMKSSLNADYGLGIE